jgi:uncharacterized protein (TIGR02145 family)
MKKKSLLFFILTTIISQTFSQTSKEIKIGNQIWMSENLNTSKFLNGDPIYEAKTIAQWIKAREDKKPAWCYYQNNPQNGLIYGKLYNWYAVNDRRGLAPKGWHISTGNEWKELISFLQKDLKDVNLILKTKTGWKQYEQGGNQVGSDCEYCNGSGKRYSSLSFKYITCAVCGGSGGDKRYVVKKILSGNGINKSGFSAKPGANRFDNGNFNENLGLLAIWWLASETQSEEINAEYIYIDNEYYTPQIDKYRKGYGSSVRLVKDKSKEILEKERIIEEEKKKKDSAQIIGKPIAIGNLLVAQYDFPNKMSWGDAQKACESLGSGWRLPTKDECIIFSQNKDKVGGFSNEFTYWSSTVAYENGAWVYNLDKQDTSSTYEWYDRPVRAVRTF